MIGRVSLWSRVRAWLFDPPAKEAPAEDTEADVPEPNEPVVVPIEESIDLHFFAPRDIPSVVDEYLREARRRDFREVRIIHGRGKGVQRARIQKQLSRHPAVVDFRSDGLGSTLAVLRPRKSRGGSG